MLSPNVLAVVVATAARVLFSSYFTKKRKEWSPQHILLELKKSVLKWRYQSNDVEFLPFLFALYLFFFPLAWKSRLETIQRSINFYIPLDSSSYKFLLGSQTNSGKERQSQKRELDQVFTSKRDKVYVCSHFTANK